MRFYHYACRHSIHDILAAKGTLRPNPNPGRQPLIAERARKLGMDAEMAWVWPVVWVTDVDVHTREDAHLIGLGQLNTIGMKGELTDCLRVQFRFIVPNVGLHPWKEWADAHVQPENAENRRLLEISYGADPTRWWVSDKPITGCRLDQSYHASRVEGTEYR